MAKVLFVTFSHW